MSSMKSVADCDMNQKKTSSQILCRRLLMSPGQRLWRCVVKKPLQVLSQSIEKKRYPSPWQRLLTCQEANLRICHLLQQQHPCLIGRIGHTEGRIVGEYLFRNSAYSRTTLKQAHQNAGIFPVSHEVLDRCASIYFDAIGQADLLGFWQTTYQARILAECHPEVPLGPLSSLEPYLHENPWSAALRGRRVLVVHPFAKSISSQYLLRRSCLFANVDVLPEFHVQVLAAPQTIAPLTAGYTTWLHALDHLVDNVLACEFDIALLGCGAYGLPLGAAIKRAGKQAVHLGGALQIMFGIRGRRWEQNPDISLLMNESWMRPFPEETPSSASLVEEGCYW